LLLLASVASMLLLQEFKCIYYIPVSTSLTHYFVREICNGAMRTC